MTSQVVETTHRGIQTVLAPRDGGQLLGGLIFRVGRADESLPMVGITHLVEHLALHEHGKSDLRYNGTTEMVLTHFFAEGSEDDIVGYFNGLCASLTDLPLERLEIEKRILRTESQGRGTPTSHFRLRHGAQGFGLGSFDDIGLVNVSPDDVSSWASRWFTKQNAVLWITSDAVPEGLDLQLPDGERFTPPALTSVLTTTPEWYAADGPETLLDAVVPRSTRANLFAAVLDKRLLRELRVDSGLCYVATAEYAPLDHQSARITAYADANLEMLGAVAGGMVDTMAGLRFGTLDVTELDAARTSIMRLLEEPDHDAARLPGFAMNLLLDHRNLTREEMLDELWAVTTEDVREIADQVWADALIRTPAGDLDWSGASPAGGSHDIAIEGNAYPSLRYDGTALVVGAEGVSLEDSDWRESVRYRDLVGSLEWPDGARMLVARDGSSVMIEPTIYLPDPGDLALVDEATAAVRVAMPPRDPYDIPEPAFLEDVPMPGTAPSRAERALAKVMSVFLYVLSAFFLTLVFIQELQPQTRGQYVGTTLGVAAFGLGGLVTAYMLGRYSRRR